MSSARAESLKILVPIAAALLVLLFLSSLASWLGFITTPLCALLLVAFFFSLYFFRDPERDGPDDPALLVSAADGLVTHVEVVDDAPFGLGRATRVSVFLSVFDVHVNRFPYAGTVTEAVHSPGLFLDARLVDSATRNERMDWMLQTTRGKVAVRQIAGLIARRIVGWIQPGEVVTTGQRLGLIRFGSRTDLFLPANCEVLVRVGDRVAGGLTPVARWTNTATAFEQALSAAAAS
jgi:phosphatidylserine decarboxylase